MGVDDDDRDLERKSLVIHALDKMTIIYKLNHFERNPVETKIELRASPYRARLYEKLA